MNRPRSVDLQQVEVPTNLGVRLQALFSLEETPATLDQLAQFAHTRLSKSLRDPRMNQYSRGIHSGAQIFGFVEYETRQRVRLENGREGHTACALDAVIEGCFQPLENPIRMPPLQ